MYALVEHQRGRLPGQLTQAGHPAGAAGRQKALEEETVGGQAGNRQCRDQRAAARDRADRQSGGPRRSQQAVARIAK